MEVDMENKFRATQIWNDAIRSFRRELPVKKHRRSLRVYDGTFTGSQAVNWIHNYLIEKSKDFGENNQKVSRTQAIALLSKFRDQKVFVEVKNDSSSSKKKRVSYFPVKDDNTLYKFTDESPSKLARTPLALKNFRDAKSQRRSALLAAAKEALPKTPDNSMKKFLKPVTPLRYRKLNDSPGLARLNSANEKAEKRLTFHEMLESLTPEEEKRAKSRERYLTKISGNCRQISETFDSGSFGKSAGSLTTDSQSLTTLPSDKTSNASNSTANLAAKFKSFDENLDSSSKILPLSSSVATSQETLVSETSSIAKTEPESAYFDDANSDHERALPEVQLVMRVVSEEEQFDIWNKVTMGMLQKVLQLDNLTTVMIQGDSFSGHDIRWNNENQNRSGFTLPTKRTDKLPRHLLKAMQVLTRWPLENDKYCTVGSAVGLEHEMLNRIGRILEDTFGSRSLISTERAMFLLNVLNRSEYLDVQEWDTAADTLSSTATKSTKTDSGPLLRTPSYIDGMFLLAGIQSCGDQLSSDFSKNDEMENLSPVKQYSSAMVRDIQFETEFSDVQPVTRVFVPNDELPKRSRLIRSKSSALEFQTTRFRTAKSGQTEENLDRELPNDSCLLQRGTRSRASYALASVTSGACQQQLPNYELAMRRRAQFLTGTSRRPAANGKCDESNSSPFREFFVDRSQIKETKSPSHTRDLGKIADLDSIRNRLVVELDDQHGSNPLRLKTLEEALSTLPGLVRSPKLLNRLRNANLQRRNEGDQMARKLDFARNRNSMAMPSTAARSRGSWAVGGGRYRTPAKMTGRYPVGDLTDERSHGIEEEEFGTSSFFGSVSGCSFFTGKGKETAIEAIQIALLVLTPKTRCWLQYLVRFVKLVSDNSCLVLDKTGLTHNRYVVLDVIWDKICKPSSQMPTSQVLRLLAFMTDFESQIFKPSESLQSQVQERLIELRKQKVGYVGEDPEKLQFCDKISAKEFEIQKRSESQEHLEKLLEVIVSNENVKPKRKREQLKNFKKEYPELYKQRFPSEKSAEAIFAQKGGHKRFFDLLRM